MEHKIYITIANKIATKTCDTRYVCGNSDYVVDFIFDEEWSEYRYKTARFVSMNGSYVDVVFEGTTCQVPAITDTYGIHVGVFAGNIKVTTPAYVPTNKSILCDEGLPSAPPDDVYTQIMKKVDTMNDVAEELSRKAENGEFDGKDGADANVTAENIAGALGYTPAKQEDVNSLSEDMAKQEEALKGKQPAGDYALKSEIPAPEPELELLETIVCDGTYNNISRTNLSLKRVVMYINTKAAEAAASIGIEIRNGNLLFGFLWISNGLNTGERWSYVKAVSDGKGDAYLEGTAIPTTTIYGSSGVNRTASRMDGSTPIGRIGIYVAGGNINFPEGTTIEIWGVRANA